MLEDIRNYVAVDRPMAANKLRDSILLRTEILGLFPEAGRQAGTGRRVFPLAGTPYVLINRITGNLTVILAVVHGHQLRRRP